MGRGRKWSAGERTWAGLVTAGVVGATLWPLTQYRRPEEDRVDGFPLSYYPMFSPRRGQYGRVTYAVGVRADGSRLNLPYSALGPGGVNQVRKQIFRAYRRGRADGHARSLATRIGQNPNLADVTRVEIVRGDFDFDAYMLDGRTEPEQLEVLGAADVPPETDAPEGAPDVLAVALSPLLGGIL
jgi:hypothetical protein